MARGPRKHVIRYDHDGVPVDPFDWTVEDWRTLWLGMGAVKKLIAARHREARERAGSGPSETGGRD